ncbi:MAG: hypothetical protein HYT79_11745 [Elusimicrobia bacterium]|nr:hypothetical protein [Elusimicrobiota bacterium]
MREATNLARLRRLMEFLGGRCREAVDIYLVGGATAVLKGWRSLTVDVDFRMIPDSDALLRELPQAKDKLNINIELASPADFLPELPGWKDRSIFVEELGRLRFYHYDPYSQVLAKIERGHDKDLQDVENFFKSGLVEPDQLMELFIAIESRLYRFPAIDAKSFRKAVEQTVSKFKEK